MAWATDIGCIGETCLVPRTFDPGRRRETTNKKPEGFDSLYPIDIDIPLDLIPPGTYPIADVLKKLKESLPYTLRYETLRSTTGRAQRGQLHSDLVTTTIVVSNPIQSVRQILRQVLDALGTEWQATVFVSHVILYKENHPYTFGVSI